MIRRFFFPVLLLTPHGLIVARYGGNRRLLRSTLLPLCAETFGQNPQETKTRSSVSGHMCRSADGPVSVGERTLHTIVSCTVCNTTVFGFAQTLVAEHSIECVSYCAYDPATPRLFAYVLHDVKADNYVCVCFKTLRNATITVSSLYTYIQRIILHEFISRELNLWRRLCTHSHVLEEKYN